MSEHEKQDGAEPEPSGTSSKPGKFEAPHPGAQDMPRWDTAELIEAPTFTAKNWLAMIGPGLVMGAAAIGGGEWLTGPIVSARYGGAMMWLATLSILGQGLYNIEISRYTLYTGEPIFTGKFRTLPGPMFWLCCYLLLDFGTFFPYLAASAATPVAYLFNGGTAPDPDHVSADWWMMKIIASCIFLGAMVPLIFGGKVYNSLKVIMSFKLVTVIGFLLILAIFYSHSKTWMEIGTGFIKFGNAPVEKGEDLNGNGVLDPGEDWDDDGNLDVVENKLDKSVDTDGDGTPDDWERDEDGKPITFADVDGDGVRDGANVENIFVSLFTEGRIPDIDFGLITVIAALAAIAGNGGLTNTPISNFTRDQGWGMGYHVGAIPSMVGGQGISLSHTGCVFDVNEETLPRWKRWYNHILRDQLIVWVPACFVGVALPSMLSVEFLRRGTEADKWNAAALTAEGVGNTVESPPDDVLASITGLSNIFSGETAGNIFWALTLFCGFLVLAPSMAATIDGILRRWIDVFWTASKQLRELDTNFIKHVYFRVLLVYGVIGFATLWAGKPTTLLTIATLIYNFALGFSCFHTIGVNTVLLPRELRPNWLVRIGLGCAGVFFTLLGTIAAVKTFSDMGLF